MSAEPSSTELRSNFLWDLHILRRRLLRRDAASAMLYVAWLYPAVVLIPVALTVSLSAFRPVLTVLAVYPAAVAAAGLVALLAGLSPQRTARRLDHLFGLKQRLATALELLNAQRPEGLAPIVIAEAASDAHQAIRRPLPYPSIARVLPAAATLVIAIALMGLVPPAWLPKLMAERRDRDMMAHAGAVLTNVAAKLHEAGPDLPGSTITRIRLDIEDFARKTAQNSLTPEEAQEQVDRFRRDFSQAGPSQAKKDLDDDLAKLEAADAARRLAGYVRHNDSAGIKREVQRLSDAFQNGTLTTSQLQELSRALGTLSSSSTQPGTAEAAGEMRKAIASGDPARFRQQLTNLAGVLAASADNVRRQEELIRNVQTELRTAAAILTGQPGGTAVSAQIAEELMPNKKDGATGSGTSSGPSSAVIATQTPTELSQQVMQQGPAVFSSPRNETPPVGYQDYVRRYFQTEKP